MHDVCVCEGVSNSHSICVDGRGQLGLRSLPSGPFGWPQVLIVFLTILRLQ